MFVRRRSLWHRDLLPLYTIKIELFLLYRRIGSVAQEVRQVQVTLKGVCPFLHVYVIPHFFVAEISTHNQGKVVDPAFRRGRKQGQ